MYKYLVIFNILLTTFIQGNTIPVSKVPVKAKFNNELPPVNGNKTNQAISEGGAIIDSNPVTLANKSLDTENLPKNLDKDLNNIKGKSVVPRKGVVYNAVEDINSHEKVDQSSAPTNSNNATNTPIELLKPKKVMLNESNIAIDAQKLNITRVHKPLILSHEALAKMDAINHLNLDENGPDIKVHSIKAGSHPGMIMPIVITILVVPMFAVLGYMAVKRGQEAWKNRHYKRMDFLLDGMYND